MILLIKPPLQNLVSVQQQNLNILLNKTSVRALYAFT